eukprot:gene25929-biopygen11880
MFATGRAGIEADPGIRTELVTSIPDRLWTRTTSLGHEAKESSPPSDSLVLTRVIIPCQWLWDWLGMSKWLHPHLLNLSRPLPPSPYG